ncbi:hypothetical protein ACTXT7_003892 [Hymenolepis weldensis]
MSLKSAVPLMTLRHDHKNGEWNGGGQQVNSQPISRRVTFKETVSVSSPRMVCRGSTIQDRICKHFQSRSISSYGYSASDSSSESENSSTTSSGSSTYTSETSSSTTMFHSSSETSSMCSGGWEEELKVFNFLKHSFSWDVFSYVL